MTLLSKSAFDRRVWHLGTAPALQRRLSEAQAPQRPNFRPGQALTSGLLDLETRNADLRLGRLGSLLGAGITDNFSVTVTSGAEEPGVLKIASGTAIATNGQTVSLGRAHEVAIADLPLVQLSGSESETMTGVCLLAVRPIAFRESVPEQILGDVAGFAWDQQRDRAAYPYVDATIIDGLELRLLRVPASGPMVNAASGINQAAQRIAQARLDEGDEGALMRGSIQLAFFGVASNGAIRWIVRQGAAQEGGGLPKSPVLPRIGNGATPRAFDSAASVMMEQLLRWRAENPGADLPPDMFAVIPPAAVVPAPGGNVPGLFPESYDRVLAPLPQSEIASVLRRSEAMAPFDLSNARDEVTWHIVVPDAHYEPELLLTPTVAPLFDQAVAAFRAAVGGELRRRTLLRQQVSEVQLRIDTEGVTDFGADDDPVAGEAGFPVIGTITVPRYDLEARVLIDAWRDALPDTLFTPDQLQLLQPTTSGNRRGVAPFQQAVIDVLKPANDLVDFGFTRVQADIYRLRQIMLDNAESTKLATFPVLAGIAKGTNALATNRSIKEYFAAAQNQTRRALENEVIVTEETTERGLAATDLLSGFSLVPSFGDTSAFAMVDDFTFAAPAAESGTGTFSFGVSSAETIKSGVSYKAIDATLVSAPKSATPSEAVLKQNFLPDSYLQGNAFAGFFDEGRKTAVEDFALKTLEDRQAGIKYANAVPGTFEDLRTVTIADRLSNPIAIAARVSALRVKADAISAIQGLGIGLTGLRAPIVSLSASYLAVPRQAFLDAVSDENANSQQMQIIEAALTPVASDTSVAFALFDFTQAERALGTDEFLSSLRKIKDTFIAQQTPISIKELAFAALQGRLDPLPSDTGDESTYLTSAVAILESVIALYRTVEGRIAELDSVILRTRKLIGQVSDIEKKWQRELSIVERDLAEARHDLRLAMALKVEETERVTALREKRLAVLAEHGKVAVYARTRRLRPHRAGLTAAQALPGVYDDPLPEVLRSRAKLPVELETMMDVLAEVPLDWFANADIFKPYLAQPKVLDKAFYKTTNDARVKMMSAASQKKTAAYGMPKKTYGGRRAAHEQTLTQMMLFYGQLQERVWTDRMQIQLPLLDLAPWKEKERAGLAQLSLNDLISGTGNKKLSKLALAQLDRIEAVVAALLASFRLAPAAVRLLWGEKLSVFDGDYTLIDATRLPGWGTLNIDLRRDILRYTEWLNRQMTSGRKEARGLMSDIQRVALLMASHSNVDDIVRARVKEAKQVAGGDVVDVVIDKGTPTIGGRVDFGTDPANPLWGKIVDLKGAQARIIVDKKIKTPIAITKTTQVFVNTLSIGRDLANAW